MQGELTESQLDISGLFWKIFESNEMAIALTDERGIMLLFNESFFHKLVEIANPINTQEVLKSVLAKDLELTQKYQYIFFNGTRNIHLSIFKVEQPTREYLWTVQSPGKDSFTARMSALKNLYRSFIETSFELIFRTSIDGKMIFSNKLFAQSFGWPNPHSTKGIDINSIFEAEDHYRAIEKKLASNRKVEKEIVFFRKTDGTRLTGMVNCHRHFDQHGKAVINWTVLDISLQVESESILKSKNDQLAKVNHQMEKFLYSTSHDLRSPITSILGLINLVKMESKDQTALTYVEKIESSTLKLDKIIRDIMSFSRATYKHTSSEKIDFELLLWKVINSHRDSEMGRKIHFEVKVSGGFPFYGDTDRIEIIIDNIIRNAIQFHDINKSRPFVRVNVSIDHSKALFEFIDNGIGIAKQHMPDIFNMFYKASHISRGAGLGLYIVKETLEKLEGTISTESEIGFGTVFRVIIPNDKKAKLIGRKLQLQHNE